MINSFKVSKFQGSIKGSTTFVERHVVRYKCFKCFIVSKTLKTIETLETFESLKQSKRLETFETLKQSKRPCLSTGVTLIIILSLFFIQSVQGQPQKPPSPIKVTTYQDLSFGTIILPPNGGSGTVTINASGGRSSTGNVILPMTGSPGAEAIFDVSAPPGTLITIGGFIRSKLFNGGNWMWLDLGPTSPVSPFITSKQKSDPTIVHIGGTLTIGDGIQNPAGSYSGTFTVTFIQQ